MTDDPVIVAENVVLDNRRDRRFDENWIRWIAGLVVTIGSLCWTFFRLDLSREPVLPDRTLTKADAPLVEKKIKFLKADADLTFKYYPHLSNKSEIQEASQAWEEVYYTPEVYPAAEKLHQLQNSRIVETRPELAEHLRAKTEYEEARYATANDPSITDKAAAIAALKKRSGSAAEGSESSKTSAQVKSAIDDLAGDPELDGAQKEYRDACEKAILKRHPELAAFYHDVDFHDQAYHHFMAEANSLSRQLKTLQSGGTIPAATAIAKHTAPAASKASSNPAAPAAPASPPLPEAAKGYGVKVGDTVDIAALKPLIALHNATLTAMDNDQLTVRTRADIFTVNWGDLTHLKAQSKKM